MHLEDSEQEEELESLHYWNKVDRRESGRISRNHTRKFPRIIEVKGQTL